MSGRSHRHRFGRSLLCRLVSISKPRQRVLRLIVIGCDLQGLAIIRSCGVVVAQLLVYGATAHIGLRIARVEPDGLVEVGDSELVLTPVCIG